MKKIISLVCVIVLLFTFVIPIQAEDTVNEKNIIKIKVNCENIEMDTAPILENNRTLVPIRVVEQLGFKVEWEDLTKRVYITGDNRELSVQIGNMFAETNIDGFERTQLLDTPPKIYNNRTMVPIRFISETMGLIVEWDGENNTVIINSPENADKCSLNKEETKTRKR